MTMPSKTEAYTVAISELESILQNESNPLTIMSTLICVLKTHLDSYYWVGFYVMDDGKLKVGPYQGTLGCTTIEAGKGVCGTAVTEAATQVVKNVHELENHIACDVLSKSEIVVPVFNSEKKVIAVFDVDSTEYGSFDEIDKMYLEQILKRWFTENSRIAQVFSFQ